MELYFSKHYMHIQLIVRNTDFVATLPKIVTVAVPLAQYWHERFDLYKALAWLREQVTDLFKDKDPTEYLQSH